MVSDMQRQELEEAMKNKKDKHNKRVNDEEIEALYESLGIKSVPDDHPIYDEAPSVVFINKPKNTGEVK